MGTYKEENEMIFDKVRRIKKGECPNFYIMGDSIPAMENLAFGLVETIVAEKLILFKGLVTHFTIKLPYCEDMKAAHEFLEHFKNSYSIAKDCYDSFCGIILIEISEEWVCKGRNEALGKILDILQECKQTCFIFIAPLTENKGKEDRFYPEMVRCGIWMKIKSQTASVEQCLGLFEKMAQENGFSVSEEVKGVLKTKLTSRKESEIENIIVVEKLMKQILFERSMENNYKKSISAQEILDVLGAERNMQKNKIGFTVDNR